MRFLNILSLIEYQTIRFGGTSQPQTIADLRRRKTGVICAGLNSRCLREAILRLSASAGKNG